MSERQTSIVLTTIFEPAFLDGFLKNLERHGRKSHTSIIIIIDRKTPPTVAQAAEAARNMGFDVQCPTLDEQEAFLQKVGAPADFIPYNTDNRRNVGFLMALEQCCEVLISIDDDNFSIDDAQDFVGLHHAVGSTSPEPSVTSNTGWFNICALISGWEGEPIHARGFPYNKQRVPAALSRTDKGHLVAMNAGLWLDEPDVDAVYRLCRRPKVLKFDGQSIVLAPDTWSPINTQNTALTREAALTYYYVRMGFPLQGLKIDRFGDILSGYLTQKVVKHLGQGVRVGDPILDHRRTPHNLFKDLYHELAGIVLVEEFLPWLVEAKLSGSSSLEAYASLADQMAATADRYKGFIWDEGGRDFLKETAGLMRTWTKIVRGFA